MNNTGHSVVLYQCLDTCSPPAKGGPPPASSTWGSEVVSPHGRTDTNLPSDNSDNYYLVERRNGQVLGCLDLKHNGYVPTARFLVTSASPCIGEVSSNTLASGLWIGGFFAILLAVIAGLTLIAVKLSQHKSGNAGLVP